MRPFIRAWNISGQQWEYFTLKELACGGVYNFPVDMPAICKWDNYKWWCQFTDLKDKNGKEIYKHDKISLQLEFGEPLEMVVIWYRDQWRPTVWPCDCCGKFTCDKKRRAPYAMNAKNWARCEIIGNIHTEAATDEGTD